MIKLQGHIEVTDSGVRIVTGWDLCRYYQWFINKEFWNTIKTQLPKFGSHVTIISKAIFKNADFTPVKHLHGKRVEFIIFPERLYQSRVNFWIPVEAPIEREIKDLCGIKDDKNFFGLHCTVANRKFQA